MYPVMYQRCGCVSFVYDIGGTHKDVHQSLQNGNTALMWALGHGHLDCAKQLLDKGVQVNFQDTVSAV